MPYKLRSIHEAEVRNIIVIDFKDEHLKDLITTLIRQNFEPYLTSVVEAGLQSCLQAHDIVREVLVDLMSTIMHLRNWDK